MRRAILRRHQRDDRPVVDTAPIEVPVITSVPASPHDVVNIPSDGYFLLPTTWMRLGSVMQNTISEFAVDYPRDAEKVATSFAQYQRGLSERIARRVWAQ